MLSSEEQLERPEQQPGRSDQHQRQRDLRDDQRAAKRRSPASARPASLSASPAPTLLNPSAGATPAMVADAQARPARKPNYLHGSSVPTLEALLDPSRGATAPHPFYLRRSADVQDVGSDAPGA
jgi:hypothetical protein